MVLWQPCRCITVFVVWINPWLLERAREKCLPIEGPDIVQKWVVFHMKNMGGVLNKTVLSLGDKVCWALSLLGTIGSAQNVSKSLLHLILIRFQASNPFVSVIFVGQLLHEGTGNTKR